MQQISQPDLAMAPDSWNHDPLLPPDAQPVAEADDEGNPDNENEEEDEEPAAEPDDVDEGNHEPDPVVEGPSELDLVAEEQAQASFEEQAILRGYDGKFQKRQ
jgi:hypothetical protein